MMPKKVIAVELEQHKKLHLLKIEWGLGSVDAVIKKMLEKME